jgi:hypothetical protein
MIHALQSGMREPFIISAQKGNRNGLDRVTARVPSRFFTNPKIAISNASGDR